MLEKTEESITGELPCLISAFYKLESWEPKKKQVVRSRAKMRMKFWWFSPLNYPKICQPLSWQKLTTSCQPFKNYFEIILDLLNNC